MKYPLIAAALAVGLVACEDGERENLDAETGMAVDTVITERTVQDTAVVRTDTTVSVDTSMNRGDGMVGDRDTVVDTRPEAASGNRMVMPADTMSTTPDTMARPATQP